MTAPLAPLDGRIVLKGLLGEGGMGEVHRAFDASLERAVAVKFLRGGAPRETERLVLEATLQARVEHQNVVRVHAVGTLGGRACLVLQLVEGRSLADLAPGLPLAARVELVRQAALGLDAAHREGLVHRDVKPGNVLVEEGPPGGAPAARLGDFGVARGEEGGLTRTGFPAGTLEFMAPEQLLGDAPLDFRADVYGLGATLYAVLAGHPPFRGSNAAGADGATGAPESLVRRILDEAPPPLGAAAPRELGLVAARAMAKAPGDRYPSALAFAEDLARFQRGEPVLARPPPAAERALKWTRRNPLAARALAAAAAAVLLGGGWAALAERRAGQEALEAARLGAAAQRMESVLRLAHLAPAHDLTPSYQAIRRTVAALREAPSRAAAGARAFAVGRGLQLLGDGEAARAPLEEAWALGFRQPEAALALGLLDAERYAQERALLPRIDDPARKAARVAALRARFGEPAVARLALVPAATAADRDLLLARVALVEERWGDAARLARAALEAGADALDAGTLEGEALLRQGLEAYERRDPAATEGPLAGAEAALRRAAEVGRSAPRPRLLLAQALQALETVREQREPGRADRYDAALAVAEEGLRLDPADAALLLVRAGLQADQGRVARRLGLDPGPALSAAVRSADAATRAAPDSRRAWDRLAWACANYVRVLRDVGYQVEWALEKGIAAAERGQRLEPGSSGPPSNLSQLHADRAELLAQRGEDGREDVAAALAAARRVVEIGDRPVNARILLAQALRQDAVSRAGRGEPSSATFEEAAAAIAGALERAAGLQPGLSGHGVHLASLWAETELLEGRSPRHALQVGAPWLATLAGRAGEDVIAGAQLGELAVIEAAGELLEGRDPTAALARAAPLLERTLRAGVHPPIRARLAEAELVRAAWLARRGGDPRPALAAARRHAEAMAAAEPGAVEPPRLEVEIVLATPAPAPAELRRARAAADRALVLAPRDARVVALRGLALAAAGDRDGAQAALAEAERLNGRQAWVAALRARLLGAAPP